MLTDADGCCLSLLAFYQYKRTNSDAFLAVQKYKYGLNLPAAEAAEAAAAFIYLRY
jgi:hypothetical protein